MCIFVEHNISVFTTPKTTTNKKTLLTQFKFAILRTFLENFQIVLNVISFSFALAAAWNTWDNSEANKKKLTHTRSWQWARDRIYKHIFSSAWMCSCVFLVLWLSIALPKMGNVRVSMPHNPIYALSCWGSLWCGKLIHIHWNTQYHPLNMGFCLRFRVCMVSMCVFFWIYT